MTANYHAIRQLNNNAQFGKGDVLVLFGELFNRGYANGLVEEAERRGMTIIRTTVGRRDGDGALRALTTEEIASIPKPFINIPLEAGFDMEPDDQGISPVEHLKDLKLSNWDSANISQASIDSSREKGRVRFLKNLRAYLKELEAHLPSGKNVLFAHLMAGGVPRAKIIMPMMNRTLKGSGDRFMSSKTFWESSLGRLCEQNFFEVSADTFSNLVEESSPLREKLEKNGSRVSYVAYGYHGTEILIGSQYRWQSYSPYLQGSAKIRLENYSREFSSQGLKTCVYNCPEILTNSSAIFSGVEISLYPLLEALRQESSRSKTPSNPCAQIVDRCLALLKPEHNLNEMIKFINDYMNSEIIQSHCLFDQWPQHNSKDQLEKMLAASDYLLGMHKDPKQVITAILSEVVFEVCGKVMLADSPRPEAPVSWISHDVITKIMARG